MEDAARVVKGLNVACNWSSTDFAGGLRREGQGNRCLISDGREIVFYG